MPREALHWNILHEASTKLESTSFSRGCLTRFPEVAELGAVAHDALYYLEGGRSELHELANLLHGARLGDPLAPLQYSLEYLRGHADQDVRECGCAFILGMLSHSCADITFHPFVFYFTGEYHDPDTDKRRIAQQRHRILEVYLDMWVVAEKKLKWSELRLSRRLGQVELVHPVLVEIITNGLLPGLRNAFPSVEAALHEASHDAVHAQNWYRGLEDMAFYQRLFFSRSVGIFARGLAKIWPERFGPLEGLFLSGRAANFHPVLSKRFHYRNPVTDEEKEGSLEELRVSGVALTSEVFRAVDTAFETEGGYERLEVLLSRRSLNYGICDAPVGKARIFSDVGIRLPDLHFESKR